MGLAVFLSLSINLPLDASENRKVTLENKYARELKGHVCHNRTFVKIGIIAKLIVGLQNDCGTGIATKR